VQLFDEITERAESVIDETLSALLESFPADIAESIAGGLRSRFRLLTHMAA
jgi:hypothetical protein